MSFLLRTSGITEEKVGLHLRPVSVPCVCWLVADQRIAKVNELNTHLEQVIRNKQQLIARLQQPFIDDYIPVELQYQR